MGAAPGRDIGIKSTWGSLYELDFQELLTSPLTKAAQDKPLMVQW